MKPPTNQAALFAEEKHALVALRAWVRGGASVEDLRAAGAVYVSAFDILAHLEGRTGS